MSVLAAHSEVVNHEQVCTEKLLVADLGSGLWKGIFGSDPQGQSHQALHVARDAEGSAVSANQPKGRPGVEGGGSSAGGRSREWWQRDREASKEKATVRSE